MGQCTLLYIHEALHLRHFVSLAIGQCVLCSGDCHVATVPRVSFEPRPPLGGEGVGSHPDAERVSTLHAPTFVQQQHVYIITLLCT